jgi:lysozyme family protein
MTGQKTDRILNDILDREGWPTYTEPSKAYPDRGGPTKGGITLTALRHWRGSPVTSPKELQTLRKEEALALLLRRYVQCNGIERLEAEPIFAHVVDNGVLSGPYRSVCDLQTALGVTVDGIIGPQTCAAVEAQRDTVGRKLVEVRALRLVAFVQTHPQQLMFLKGWLRRVFSFLEEA